MNSVFVLQHSYEHDDGHDEVKMIGVYSSEEKARETVEKLKNAKGFCDYPIECFYIDEYEIDKDNWIEGFFSYRYTV
jgi:hypothetical protein